MSGEFWWTNPTSLGAGGGSGPELSNTAPVNADAAAADAGDSSKASHADHKHSITVDAPVALTVGGASVEGTADALARADHEHELPDFGVTAGTFAEGNDARFRSTSDIIVTITDDDAPYSAVVWSTIVSDTSEGGGSVDLPEVHAVGDIVVIQSRGASPTQVLAAGDGQTINGFAIACDISTLEVSPGMFVGSAEFLSVSETEWITRSGNVTPQGA